MKLKSRGCLAAAVFTVVFTFSLAFAQSQTGEGKPLLPSESAAPAVPAPAPAPAAKTKDPHIKPGTDYPHEELSLLYSYFHMAPGNNLPKADFNGGSGSFAYNFNRYLGLAGDFGGYHSGDYAGVQNISTNIFSYMVGPRVSFRNDSIVTPFVQLLLGGAHRGGGPAVLGNGPSLNGFALATGGGLDWTLTKRFALRLPQIEYMMTRLDPNIAGIPSHQNDMRTSAGLVVRWGYKPVIINQAPTAACSVNPAAVTIGAATTVALNVNGSDADGDSLTYNYSATGGSINGTAGTARWDLAGANPGSYNATAQVSDGHGGTSSCSAAVTVNPRPIPPNRPPTVSLTSDRDTVLVGECIRFTANGADPDGDRLNYSWTANGGQVTPTNNTAQLCTVGLAPGMYTMTVRVEDGKGGAADARKTITVTAPPPPPEATKLSECAFKPAASARVDNVCKRILDDVATRLQNDARARVVVIGYADPKARRSDQLATSRGQNTVKYLQTKGIDANRITVRSGAGQVGGGAANQRVELIWVPEGATY
jgi:outer membrane protein OmpA-like peptidoglycan-associated protein